MHAQHPRGFTLAGKTVLITGAARGIGAATAKAVSELGADLVLFDVEDCSSISEEVTLNGARVTARTVNVADRSAVEKACIGLSRVDAAVLNAGTNSTEKWTSSEWDRTFQRTMDVNVGGILNVARLIVPDMIKRQEGRVVLVGSLVATNGGSNQNVPPHYVASKGAVQALVKWMAKQFSPHVLVNAVAPGPTATAMTAQSNFDCSHLPIPRMALAEEIAWPIAFLCSPAASYMTGATLDINGGAAMR